MAQKEILQKYVRSGKDLCLKIRIKEVYYCTAMKLKLTVGTQNYEIYHFDSNFWSNSFLYFGNIMGQNNHMLNLSCTKSPQSKISKQ